MAEGNLSYSCLFKSMVYTLRGSLENLGKKLRSGLIMSPTENELTLLAGLPNASLVCTPTLIQ